MAVINEKTKLPLGAALGLILAVAPAFGLFSVARADVENLKSDVRELKAKQASQDAGQAETRQDVAVIKKQMEFQTEMIKEIRDEMRRGR